MCMVCYPSAPGTFTTNSANGTLTLTAATSTWPTVVTPSVQDAD